jgi:hypothetical protein
MDILIYDLLIRFGVLVLGIGLIMLSRCEVALKVNDDLLRIANEDIANAKFPSEETWRWYAEWSIVDFICNPLRWSLWTAEKTAEWAKRADKKRYS